MFSLISRRPLTGALALLAVLAPANGQSWQQTLTGQTTSEHDRFGTSLAYSDELLFVGCPRDNFAAIGFRTVDQLQCNLWLGLEDDVVRDVRFFRRAGSLAHSSGRYIRASRRQSNPGAEYARATLLTQFSIFPRLPLYCRLTPAVSWPLLAVPVSSIQPMASG